MYSKKDAQHFLKNYQEIEKNCNLFLVYGFSAGEKEEIGTQKTGRENERNLIKKLEDKHYVESRRILKCVENFFSSLTHEETMYIRARYVTRLTYREIANKYHYSVRTLKRKDKKLLDRFLMYLNEKH